MNNNNNNDINFLIPNSKFRIQIYEILIDDMYLGWKNREIYIDM